MAGEAWGAGTFEGGGFGGGEGWGKPEGATVRYRALFEFVARSEDELSFQPGDVILVFQACIPIFGIRT